MKDSRFYSEAEGHTVEIFANWYVFYGKQEAENMNEDRWIGLIEWKREGGCRSELIDAVTLLLFPMLTY